MTTRVHRFAMLSAAVLLAAGCGSSSGSDNGKASSSGKVAAPAGKADTYILGTTDKVVALDPAGAYDLGSQQLIGNIYQNLLVIPAGGNKPTPDAAESCDFTDPKTFVCKLKSGLKFSSGDALTSEDVKFSLDRQLKIADPSGPSSLLASLKSVDATLRPRVGDRLRVEGARTVLVVRRDPGMPPRNLRSGRRRHSPDTRRRDRARPA